MGFIGKVKGNNRFQQGWGFIEGGGGVVPYVCCEAWGWPSTHHMQSWLQTKEHQPQVQLPMMSGWSELETWNIPFEVTLDQT